MTAVIGVDLQLRHSVIALREAAEWALPQSVGDGYRRIVPNACLPTGEWGSRAADAGLAGTGMVTPKEAQHLVRAWLVEPWAAPFLAGLRRRLEQYLGRVELVHRHGYLLCLAVPDGSARRQQLRDRCREVGLGDVAFVSPAAALLCRWLAESVAGAGEPRSRPQRSIAVVACGEDRVVVAGYVMTRDDTHTPIRALGRERLIEEGTGILIDHLAGLVLSRCRESVPARSLPALIDGCHEFAAHLSATGPDAVVEWQGPLADRLFATVRLGRKELSGLPELRRAADRTASTVADVLDAAGASDRTILVGGLGAVWPVLPDALSTVAPVVRCSDPEFDGAFGATWWPRLRPLFAPSSHDLALSQRSAVLPAPDHAPGADDVRVRDDIAADGDPAPTAAELPPWLRDRFPDSVEHLDDEGGQW